MNRTILLILVIIAGCISEVMCQEARPSGDMLTLDQAIQIALKNNRGAKNARLDIEKSEDKLDAYKTRRLPAFKITSTITQPLSSFDTTFEKGVFGDYPGVGPVPNEDTIIKSSTNTTGLLIAQVTQPLTQLRRLGLQIKQKQLDVEISTPSCFCLI